MKWPGGAKSVVTPNSAKYLTLVRTNAIAQLEGSSGFIDVKPDRAVLLGSHKRGLPTGAVDQVVPVPVIR